MQKGSSPTNSTACICVRKELNRRRFLTLKWPKVKPMLLSTGGERPNGSLKEFHHDVVSL